MKEWILAILHADAAGQMKLGESVAASIVVTCLYFVGAVGALANLKYTRYRFYTVLAVAASFRCVAYGARAGYLSDSTPRPSLVGVFLAFANAGYGINLVVLYIVQASWCKRAVLPTMSSAELRFWNKASVVLIFPIIAFGPIIGVIAAGFLFGNHTPSGQAAGTGLRQAATWGLWGSTMMFTLTNARLFLAAAMARPSSDDAVAQHVARGTGGKAVPLTSPRRQQQLLVGVLGLLSLPLHVRALVNVALLYPSEMFLSHDNYWYPLDAMCELIVLYIMVAPTLLARISLYWPRPTAEQKQARAVEMQARQSHTAGKVADEASVVSARANGVDGRNNGHTVLTNSV